MAKKQTAKKAEVAPQVEETVIETPVIETPKVDVKIEPKNQVGK